MTTVDTHDPPFVVACPVCGGWSAVTAGMAGQAACCPLCAAAFLVPRPPPMRPAAPPAAPPFEPDAAEPAPTPPAPPTFEVPDHVLVTAEPTTDLQFHEPAAKTVGYGANRIELRRLTTEEKDARRRRRNLIILLTGAALLIAITLLLGTARPRRRPR